jgi:hypothetical protein
LNIQPMLMANTNVNERNIYEKQNEMENPMVLVMDANTLEVMEYFKIVAEDMDDLNLMYEKKIFFTSSIPVDTVEHKYGAIFMGVEPDYYLNEDGEENELAQC